MNAIKKLLGSGLGSGYSPFAPGTLGSLVALAPIYFLGSYFGDIGLIAFITLSSLITFWVNSYFETEHKKDSEHIVSDEWAGQAVVFLTVSMDGVWSSTLAVLLSGFLIFRLFDIWKPLGIAALQDLKGAWGVLADDLLAGFYTLICLKTLIFALPELF